MQLQRKEKKRLKVTPNTTMIAKVVALFVRIHKIPNTIFIIDKSIEIAKNFVFYASFPSFLARVV